MSAERRHEMLYGRRPVLETLRAGRRSVHRVFLRPGFEKRPELDGIVALARERGVSTSSAGPAELDRISGGGNHQGVAARVSSYPYADLSGVLKDAQATGREPLVLILDHLEDPQNVGSLLRSAESAGVDVVVIPSRRAAGITPSAVRASAGAAEHLCVAVVPNLVQCIRKLKDGGLWIAGLDCSDASEIYTDRDLTGPVALVVGSEGNGMARLVRETCDFLIHIPLRGKVESLNAGVAGGIALFEILRQQRNSKRAVQ